MIKKTVLFLYCCFHSFLWKILYFTAIKKEWKKKTEFYSKKTIVAWKEYDYLYVKRKLLHELNILSYKRLFVVVVVGRLVVFFCVILSLTWNTKSAWYDTEPEMSGWQCKRMEKSKIQQRRQQQHQKKSIRFDVNRKWWSNQWGRFWNENIPAIHKSSAKFRTANMGAARIKWAKKSNYWSIYATLLLCADEVRSSWQKIYAANGN